MGVVATGVGIQFAIKAASGEAFTLPVQSALCGGITVFLAGVTTLQWTSPTCLPRKAMVARSLLAVFSLCLIAFNALISPIVVVGLMAVLLVTLNKVDGLPLVKG